MKTQIIKSILLLFAAITGVRADSVSELHVGVSPFLRSPERQALLQQFPALLLEPARLPRGARVVVWDGWRLIVIAEFNIPALKFDSQQSRAPHVLKPLAALGQWLRAAPLTDPEIPSELPALKAPELLELISRQRAASHRSVLLAGSPLYVSLTEPAFSMTEARYPADGHLRVPLSESVFGLAEKTNRLANTTVHWCYFTEGVWRTELHRNALTRFWSLFVQGQNGVLTTFGADLPMAFANTLRTDIPPVGRFAVDPESEKIEMRTAGPRAVPLWLQKLRPAVTDPVPAATGTAPTTNQPPAVTAPAEQAPALPPPTEPVRTSKSTLALSPEISVDPVAANPVVPPIAEEAPPPVPPVPEPPLSAPQPNLNAAAVPDVFPVQPDIDKTGFGIAWSARGVDLDLYVRPHSKAQELV